ncbi:c-type cytochrome [uncultured Moraxella sp.]|uniref:c-type cytochrome n=1 Tax=uncultured Moraxella sp. TaxID=263769 RepID=UPI0025D0C6CA|nr:c-type cytochrome [uncultured Moraxella sp.]
MKPAKKATLAKIALASGIGLASLSASASYPVPAYDIAAGKVIVDVNCAACHGANGVSPSPMQPNLGGQNIKYLYKQLVDFKTKARRNGVMEAQLVGLTQQDLANVAGYYANQAPWTPGYGNKATYAAATKLYLGGDKTRGVIPCAGCHDPKGAGNAFAAFPRLGGQHATYLATQLKLFRAAGRQDEVATDMEVRTNDSVKKGEPGMMQIVASKLSDRDIKILSEFLTAVH